MLSESNLLATIRKLAISYEKTDHLLGDSLASTAVTNWLYYMLVQRVGVLSKVRFTCMKNIGAPACTQ